MTEGLLVFFSVSESHFKPQLWFQTLPRADSSGSGGSAQKWEGFSGISKLGWVQSTERLFSPTAWIYDHFSLCLLISFPSVLSACSEDMLCRWEIRGTCFCPAILLPTALPVPLPRDSTNTLAVSGAATSIQKLENCPRGQKATSAQSARGWPI